MLADGFLFVKDDAHRLTHHVAVLLVLAAASEPCFDLMEFGFDFAAYSSFQNNIWTLLLGYVALIATDALAPDGRLSMETGRRLNTVALICCYVLVSCANLLTRGNFNLVGPLLVVALYWYLRAARGGGRSGMSWSRPRRLGALLAIFVPYLIVYFWARSGFGDLTAWWHQVVAYLPWVAGHLVAVLIICLYDGTLGSTTRGGSPGSTPASTRCTCS